MDMWPIIILRRQHFQQPFLARRAEIADFVQIKGNPAPVFASCELRRRKTGASHIKKVVLGAVGGRVNSLRQRSFARPSLAQQ
jgi:hypothetical protein